MPKITEGTVGEYWSLAGWFVVQNSLYGFSRSFNDDCDKVNEPLQTAIATQFGVSLLKIREIKKSEVLIGEAAKLLGKFRALINKAKGTMANR